MKMRPFVIFNIINRQELIQDQFLFLPSLSTLNIFEEACAKMSTKTKIVHVFFSMIFIPFQTKFVKYLMKSNTWSLFLIPFKVKTVSDINFLACNISNTDKDRDRQTQSHREKDKDKDRQRQTQTQRQRQLRQTKTKTKT